MAFGSLLTLPTLAGAIAASVEGGEQAGQQQGVGDAWNWLCQELNPRGFPPTSSAVVRAAVHAGSHFLLSPFMYAQDCTQQCRNGSICCLLLCKKPHHAVPCLTRPVQTALFVLGLTAPLCWRSLVGFPCGWSEVNQDVAQRVLTSHAQRFLDGVASLAAVL